jgi:DNA-directed RNA polymerase specialized sigma24 family protein
MNRVEGPRYGVTDEVERTIRKQATGFAHRAGMPHVADDLAQEARIAAWQTAVIEGDTDQRHILADTRERIRDVARLGTSVDGKIFSTWKRPRLYGVISLEMPVGDGENVFGEILVDGDQSVEDQALGLLMVGDIAGLLTAEEERVLRAKLEGFTHQEIITRGELMTPHLVKKHARKIREKVARYLEREDLL